MAKKKDSDDLSKADRLKLSYKVFSNRAFREWLLCDPSNAAADIGIALPHHEVDEIRKYANHIRMQGYAVDLLVMCGKDIATLWANKDVATFGINRIVDPGDWRANYPKSVQAKKARKVKKVRK